MVASEVRALVFFFCRDLGLYETRPADDCEPQTLRDGQPGARPAGCTAGGERICERRSQRLPLFS